VGYVGKGEKWSLKSGDKNTMTMNFNYLEIPLLLKGMMPAGIFKPMLYVGPTFNFLLSADVKEHSEQVGFPTRDTTISVPDSTRNNFEFGLALGAGTTINAGPGAIIFDVRYTFGFTSIPKLTASDKASGQKEEDVDMKTGTLAIMIGYQLKFYIL